jgi:predicted N-acyltransferase
VLLEEGYQLLGSVGEYVKDIQYQGYVVNEKWAQANEALLSDSCARFENP